MFQKAKNIDSAFRQLRRFSFIVLVCVITLAGFVFYKSYKLTIDSQSRIYILANGKILEAYAGDRRENLPVEARDHVRTFHQYFFTLHPDDQVISSNISKALYLADRSARNVYQSLKENNYYAGIIAGNISQEITVDSIWVDVNSSPISFRLWGEQKITRPSNITTRLLITEGQLRTVSRSDHNPHGFLIERWRTIENKDLKTESR